MARRYEYTGDLVRVAVTDTVTNEIKEVHIVETSKAGTAIDICARAANYIASRNQDRFIDVGLGADPGDYYVIDRQEASEWKKDTDELKRAVLNDSLTSSRALYRLSISNIAIWKYSA